MSPKNFLQSTLGYCSGSVQQPIMALIWRALSALVVLGILGRINRSLLYWTLNNWQRPVRWNPKNEVVLLTGSSGGRKPFEVKATSHF
ncbi:hypothetical protein BDV26DRAFT_255776 [Aspergillus bertholletiae]|uniref:Uncharacterized protein n=1 Tax=Aspergillus bertholletiae TaxID=1226010 RepID=A0A5N7BHX0_9EURO|nr:hypothetical protein BDV26DRAFT_255776 [Aspergillus bertholletiae]